MNFDIIFEFFDKRIMRLRLVWLALFLSGPIYILVCVLFKLKEASPLYLDIDSKFIAYPLFAFGFILCVFSVTFLESFLRRRIHRTTSLLALYLEYSRSMLIKSSAIESLNIFGIIIFILFHDIQPLIHSVIITSVFKYYIRPQKTLLIDTASYLVEHNKITEISPS